MSNVNFSQNNEEREKPSYPYLGVWLALALLFFTSRGFSQSSQISCDNIMVTHDLETRYEKIRLSLEADFKNGHPKVVREKIIDIRSKIDNLTTQLFTLNNKDSQEYLHFTNQTLQTFEELMAIIPQASQLAPTIRNKYVIPLTNLNSLRADYQDCQVEQAIANAEKQIQDEQNQQTSENLPVENRAVVYRSLVSELTELNKKLYNLETSNIQKMMALHSQISLQVEEFQNDQTNDLQNMIAQKMPEYLNAAQNEIEKMLPGLELSQNFYVQH